MLKTPRWSHWWKQKSHDRGQERKVGMYSTPTEVNIYIYKAVGEMHPSLQI